MNSRPTPITGMVLSGGASYAAYEVGVVKALMAGHSPATNYVPLNPSVIVGTSAGAFNATVLAGELGNGVWQAAEFLEAVWREKLADHPNSCGNGVYRIRGDATRFLDPGCLTPNPFRAIRDASDDFLYFARDSLSRGLTFLSSREPPSRRIAELINLHTIFSLEPFKTVLKAAIKPEAVMSSAARLGVVTTNWTTGSAEVFTNRDMTTDRWLSILMAAASVPGLPPVEVSGEFFADGAFVANTPIIPAIEFGADTLHVVYVDPELAAISKKSLDSTIGLIEKLYLLFVASAFNRDINIVRDVNRGIELLGSGSKPYFTNAGMELSFLRSLAWMESAEASGISLRPITLHRYRPREDPGGILGKMNFDYSHIAALIDLGYRDAVTHDCETNHCVLQTETNKSHRSHLHPQPV